MLNKYPYILLFIFLIYSVSVSSAITGDEMFEIGNSQYTNGSLSPAIESWKQAMDLDPTLSANAYYNIGLAYAGLKEYEKAIVAWNQTLFFVPNSSRTYDNMGTAYAILGMNEEAGMSYDMAIAIDPEVVKYRIDKELLMKSVDKEKTPLSNLGAIISLITGMALIFMKKYR